jgi:hypothetical protein
MKLGSAPAPSPDSIPKPAPPPKWLALLSRWPTLQTKVLGLYTQLPTLLGKLNAQSEGLPTHIARVKALPGTHFGFAAFGLVVVASLLVYVLSEDDLVALPGCGDADVQEVVRDLVKGALTQQGVPEPKIDVSDFQSGGSAPDAPRQLCTFVVSDQGEKLTMYMSVSWKDVDTGEYQVMIGSTYDSVSE